jgi:hypothetical protein
MAKAVIADEANSTDGLSRQAVSFFLHTFLAIAVWLGIMLAGYALNPVSVPQPAILAVSILVPLIVGNIVARFHASEHAVHVWLVGLIWLLIVCLWILDMPTGPNACQDCGASEKLLRTLFSFPSPSGLIDNNGPFLGT